MSIINNCDSLANWTVQGGSISIENGKLKIIAEAGGWNVFVDLNNVSISLLEQLLKFNFKTDDSTPSALTVTLFAPNYGGLVSMSFLNQSSTVGADVLLDPTQGTTEGTPNLADIRGIRFVFQNRGQPFTYYIDTVESVPAGTPPTPPSTTYPTLPLIAESNFASGISPFGYSGAGSYELVPEGVKVWNSPTDSSRGTLVYETIESSGEAMIETVISMDKFGVGAVLMPYQPQTAASAELAFVGDAWILQYLDGTVKRADIANVNALNRKYKIVVYVKYGAGTGQIRVWIDDVERLTLNNLNNIALSTFKLFEVGNYWGVPAANTTIEYIKLYQTPLVVVAVTGQITDSQTLQGVPYAGIRFGFGDNFVADVIADANGNYALQLPESTYSLVKILKRGYGNKIDPTGVSIFNNIVVSAANPIINFSVTPQALFLPTAVAPPVTPWKFRGVTLFPWTFGNYSSAEFAQCLAEIKTSMPHCNGIELRLYLLGKSDGSVVFCDAWGNNTDPTFYNTDTLSGIDQAHAKGFKTFVGIVLLVEAGFIMNNPAAFFANHEARLAEYCQLLEGHNVEYISLSFEPQINLFKYDSYLQTLFPTCRTKTTAKLGFCHHKQWYAPNDALAGSWWLDADFLYGLGWMRMTYKSDPTHQELLSAWSAPPDWSYSSEGNPAWSEGTSKTYPNPMALAKAYQKSVSPRLLHDILIIVNTGIPCEDFANMNPWGSGSKVYDLDEQALYFKTFFEAWSDVPNMLGLDAERHGDKHNDAFLTGTASIRGRPAELFVEEGFKAASGTEPPTPPTGENGFAIIAILAAVILLGIAAFSMKGGD